MLFCPCSLYLSFYLNQDQTLSPIILFVLLPMKVSILFFSAHVLFFCSYPNFLCFYQKLFLILICLQKFQAPVMSFQERNWNHLEKQRHHVHIVEISVLHYYQF